MTSIQELIQESKKRGGRMSEIEKIIEREKMERAAELERLKLERMVEEERARLMELKKKTESLSEGNPTFRLSNDLLTSILQMANVDPKKAAEFIKELGEDDLRKLSMLMASGSSSAAALLALARRPETDVKTLVEALRSTQPQVTLEGLAALLKTVFEITEKKSQPSNQTDHITLMKTVIDTFKPFYEMLAQKDRELFEERLRQLESRIIDPRQWLESIKSDAQLLGYGSSNIDKDVEKLRLELERWKTEKELEFKKWMVEKELSDKKWSQIGQIIQGPIGEVFRSLGGAAADRIRGASGTPQVEVEKTVCPKCNRPFYVERNAERAICPNCGAVLVKSPGGGQAEQPTGEEQPAGESGQEQVGSG
jgi:ribosomal protein S27E